MNFQEKILKQWEHKQSFVCIGLDPDIKKLPECLKNKKYPVFEFNKAIIDATHSMVCAYKPQIAYYSGQNIENELHMTIEYIQNSYPEIPIILDAKRGDIGATAKMYAKEAFDIYRADAVTVNPFMGTDSLAPFLERKDKGIFILCRTSNPGGNDIQNLKIISSSSCQKAIYSQIAEYAQSKWNYNNNVGLVIGATYPQQLKEIRSICPNIPFLVPGVGAQGGDVKKVINSGLTKRGTGLIINSSRAIIYAGTGDDFAEKSRNATEKLFIIIKESVKW